MKKVISPSIKEESVYYSDFSGTCFKYGPEAELKLEFNYGSAFDGSKLEFHLTDQEVLELINFLKTKMSKDCIDNLKNILHKENIKYQDSLDFRDWHQCDYIHHKIDLLKKLTE